MLNILIIIKTINVPIFGTVEIIWYNTRNNVSYHCCIWIMIHKSQTLSTLEDTRVSGGYAIDFDESPVYIDM